MKQLIVILSGCFFILLACNDNNQTAAESGVSDSARKSADSPATAHHDTSASTASGNLMMSSMTKHMDEMKNMKSMNDPDHDFAMMMKHHHMVATEMAQAELSQGHHDDVKALAKKMLDDQTKEIKQIDNFLANTPADNKAGNDKFHHEAMQMMNDMPVKMDHSGKDVDQQFTSMMISHHEQGIHMAKMYLKYGKKQEMKTLANKIINAQEKEIKELKDLQAKSH